MTYGKLERANELADEIDHMGEIQQLFCTHFDYNNPLDHIHLTRASIPLNADIPADICEEIIALIQKKKDKLTEEFNAL